MSTPLRVVKIIPNNLKKYSISYRVCATRGTKLETITESNTTANTIPVPPIKNTTVPEVQELVTHNDILLKDNIVIRNTEVETLGSTASFDEVPGPKVLRRIAQIWNYIPIIGNQVTTSTIQYILSANHLLGSRLSWGKNGLVFRWMMNEYGPIVRLQGPFGGNIVVLSRPDDALSVFASEGRYPIRSSLDSLEKYRMEYRKFKNAGPFLMFGENWEKLRKQITDTLNKSTPYQFKHIENVSNEFIAKINQIKNKQGEVPVNFWDYLSKWSLECLCSVILGKKLGFLTSQENISTSEYARLFNAYRGATEAVRSCESGMHLWKLIETPSWKSLVKNCDIIDHIFGKHLQEVEENLRKKKKDPIMDILRDDVPMLEAMLLQEGTLPEDILTVILDMLLIGINAITHSVAFMFYHLARFPRTQRLVYEEIKALPEQIKAQDLHKMTYLKACIKESLRLKPPIPFLNRVLTKDTVISNYRVPKGTTILMATYLSSIQEEHFDDALKFVPERWLNAEPQEGASLACIPFGYGPKACLARNLAEMQLSILMIKVLNNYKIQYHYGDISSSNRMLAYPDKPLKFRFETRHN